MKKLVAILLVMITIFSFASLPASAADFSGELDGLLEKFIDETRPLRLLIASFIAEVDMVFLTILDFLGIEPWWRTPIVAY